jgi:hypothetical protein
MSNEIESIRPALSLQMLDPTTRRWMFVLGNLSRIPLDEASKLLPGLKFRLAKKPRSQKAVMKSKRWVVLANPFPTRRLERDHLLDESSRSLFDLVATSGLPNNLTKVLHAFLSHVDVLTDSVKNLEHPERFD